MRIPSYVMHVIAVLALAFAAWFAFRSATLVIGGERLAGEVVRIVAGSDESESGGSSHYRPVVRYLDAHREPAEWTGRGERHASIWGPGDKVELLRGGGDPPRIEMNRFSELWAGSIVCLVLAWLFAGVGVLMQMSDGEPGRRLAGAFCLYFGLPFLAGGIAAAAVAGASLANGSRVAGMVMNGEGVEWTLLKESGRSSRPAVVRLTAADGREVQLTDTQADATYFAPEAKVEVLHPPGRPYAGRVYTPFDHWLGPAILLGVGAPMTAIGVLLFRVRGRATTRRRTAAG